MLHKFFPERLKVTKDQQTFFIPFSYAIHKKFISDAFQRRLVLKLRVKFFPLISILIALNISNIQPQRKFLHQNRPHKVLQRLQQVAGTRLCFVFLNFVMASVIKISFMVLIPSVNSFYNKKSEKCLHQKLFGG